MGRVEESLESWPAFAHQGSSLWPLPWVGSPLLAPGRQGGLACCNLRGRKESDTTEWLNWTELINTEEKEMATHSGILAWRMPGTEEPGGLLSMGSHRVGHDWSNLGAAAAMNIEAHTSFQIRILSGYMSRSRIVGSYGNSIFNFLRIFHTVLHRGSTNHVPTNSAGGFPFLHPLSSFYCRFFDHGHQIIAVRWYIIIVFICISWIVSDTEHLFMCLLAICTDILCIQVK